MTISAVVDWAALGKSVAAASVAAVAVAVLYGLAVAGIARRRWVLAAAGGLGSLAAIAAGLIAMTHK